MQHSGIDRLARALALPSSRRGALLAIGAAILGADTQMARGMKRVKTSKRSSNKDGFPRNCRRFVIAAGPNRDDEFQHIDDDLSIELIPKGRKGVATVIFDDDNDRTNGDDGAHLTVDPFTAKVGDLIRIVARNEVAVGCELDEIWLHCIEGKGGKVLLNERITSDDCQDDANTIGVFLDTTVRIHNK